MIIDENTKVFAEDIIRNRTFVGKVITKKSDDLDVIIVDENNEAFISKMKLVDNLLGPLVKLKTERGYWLKYNEFDQSIIYSKLETKLKPGWYWFIVKGLVFQTDCIYFNLNTIHSLTMPETNSDVFYWEKFVTETSEIIQKIKNNSFTNDVFNKSNILILLANLSVFIRFSFLLFVFLFTTLVDVFKVFLIYLPSYLTGFAHIITAFSPVIKEIITCCTKIVGGFFLFLCMIWKDLIVTDKRSKQNSYDYHSQMRNIQKIKYYK